MGFVFGIVTVFAAYFLAQAIAPGSVTVPPQDITQDVELRKLLDCQLVTGGSFAECDDLPPGYKLTGGGGRCGAGNAKDPQFFPDLANNRFHANCSGSGNETAYAICCKFVQ